MRKNDRFKKVLEYFKSLRNYLKSYDIYEDDGINNQSSQTHSSLMEKQ